MKHLPRMSLGCMMHQLTHRKSIPIVASCMASNICEAYTNTSNDTLSIDEGVPKVFASKDCLLLPSFMDDHPLEPQLMEHEPSSFMAHNGVAKEFEVLSLPQIEPHVT